MTLHACPDCRCDDLPQPSRSNDRHRKAVIAGALQVLETKRRARTTVNETAEESA